MREEFKAIVWVALCANKGICALLSDSGRKRARVHRPPPPPPPQPTHTSLSYEIGVSHMGIESPLPI